MITTIPQYYSGTPPPPSSNVLITSSEIKLRVAPLLFSDPSSFIVLKECVSLPNTANPSCLILGEAKMEIWFPLLIIFPLLGELSKERAEL